MPPTKHKTGDIFFAHVHDAMFDLVGVTTKQTIELLGMFSEAIHNPLLMDRYLSLKATRYVHGACKHLGDEIEFKPDGIVARAREQVLDEALRAARRGQARVDLGRHRPRRLRRREAHAHRRQGLRRAWSRGRADYVNPLLEALERAGPDGDCTRPAS